MKYILICMLTLALGAGCRPKELSGAALQSKLMETMSDHLHKTLNPAITFMVKDVVYFTDVKKKEYLCEFNVTMNIKGKDTTGTVAANISNDFNKVVRTR